MGTVSSDEVFNRLPEHRRKKIKERVKKAKREYETLQALRKELGLTQEDIAAALEVSQNNVSTFESRNDIKLSTLQAYAKLLGGEVIVSIKFPDRPPCEIKSLSGKA